ncbi:hypothetical protein H4R21_003050 [Coemansia helicoidea]|uniref:Uncharacterized protein n=2 Tax=Coemansia TaxID=4863 RepID=A0ACC1L4B0_9FUNG|nr:hypothetical protein H4R21_003050 [Coemansia helicoidea]
MARTKQITNKENRKQQGEKRKVSPASSSNEVDLDASMLVESLKRTKKKQKKQKQPVPIPDKERKREAENIVKEASFAGVAEVLNLSAPHPKAKAQAAQKLADKLAKFLESQLGDAAPATDVVPSAKEGWDSLLGEAASERDYGRLAQVVWFWINWEERCGTIKTFEGRESALYPRISALVLFIGLCLRHGGPPPEGQRQTRSATAGSVVSGVARLLLPYARPDFKPGGFDEAQRVDNALRPCAATADAAVQPQHDPMCHDFAAIVEVKPHADQINDALAQAVDYSRCVHLKQFNRRFVWALTVCSTQVRACVILHDCVLQSPPMDIATPKGRQQLVGWFVNMSMCDNAQLGFDPSIKVMRKNLLHIDCPAEDGNSGRKPRTETYVVSKCLSAAETVSGRLTRCFLATREGDKGRGGRKPEFVIKDAWAIADSDDRSEVKLFAKVAKEFAKNPPDFLYPQMVAGGNVCIKGAGCGAAAPDSTDAIFVLLGATRQDVHNVTAADGSLRPATSRERKWEEQQFRVHWRIVMTPVGSHISTVENEAELIIVLEEAMRCHDGLFTKCGILHRDVSMNNILVVRQEVDGETVVRGLLIDLDNAVLRPAANEGSEPARSEQDEIAQQLKKMDASARPPIYLWTNRRLADIAKDKRTHMDSAKSFRDDIIQYIPRKYRIPADAGYEEDMEMLIAQMEAGEPSLQEPPTNTESRDPLAKRVEYEDAIVENLLATMKRAAELLNRASN